MRNLFAPTFLLLLSLTACTKNIIDPADTEPELQILDFTTVATAESDSIRTLRSLKKEGDLYLITYHGGYRTRLEALNDRIIEHGIYSVIPSGTGGNACSIFSALGNPDRPIFGRNLDNHARRAVLVGLYRPPDGYASIAVSNMINMGFGPEDDPTRLPVEERTILLNCVLFVTDGMNERGVSVALASVDAQPVVRDESKRLVNLSLLQREILDFAGSLEEAVAIVENRDVFDRDVNTLSHHILIADASGRSAAAEYSGGRWRILRNDRPWQIVTNTPLFEKSEEWIRSQCSRYRTADDYLQNVDGNVTWQEGMDVLQMMSVGDTQWSSINDPAGRNLYISLYRDYHHIQAIQIQ